MKLYVFPSSKQQKFEYSGKIKRFSAGKANQNCLVKTSRFFICQNMTLKTFMLLSRRCPFGTGKVSISGSKRRIKTVRQKVMEEDVLVSCGGGKSSVKNRKGNCWPYHICFVVLRVAAGMFIPDSGSEFFPSWIRIFPSRILIKEFKYFNPKSVSKLSGI
jgi:hypothetical protein